MDLDSTFTYLVEHWKIITEAIAATFGVACVYLNSRENIWGWPTAIISVGLYVIIFFDSFLYSDFVLNAIYVVLNAYGWYNWLYGGEERDSLPITHMRMKEVWFMTTIGIAGLIFLGFTFQNLTDAAVPYWDAYTTSFSLIAMYLMAKKKLENWIYWIAVNPVAMGIYLYKELYITTTLFGVYLGLAIYGYFNWRNLMSKQDIEFENQAEQIKGSAG